MTNRFRRRALPSRALWGLLVCVLFLCLFAPPARSESRSYRLSRLYYTERVLYLIKNHYVDASQLNFRSMLRRALESVEKTIPSVRMKFSKGGKDVRVFVKKNSQRFSLQQTASKKQFLYLLRKIFSFLQEHYRGPLGFDRIEFSAIRGILSILDPYTRFLNPTLFKRMQSETRGSFGGLGIVVQRRKTYLNIYAVFPDTPAERAGLQASDQIVRVRNESTVNMTLEEVQKRLQGKPGTTVVLWIKRKGIAVPKRFVVKRAIIRVKSLREHLLPKSIGYIQIKSFQEDTAVRLYKALARLRRRSRRKLKGLILDLRNNPGGLLGQAVKVSNLFLRSGVIVSHRGARTRRSVYQANSFGTEPNYPIVVLLNGLSASAAEIVAGALKNHNRAIVVGQRSYGKGTVQILFPVLNALGPALPLSAVKMTVAQYLTPGDISIQGIGIVPDIQVSAIHVSKRQFHSFGSNRRWRKKLKKLPAYVRGVKANNQPVFRLPYFDSRSMPQQRIDEAAALVGKHVKLDYEIKLAHALLQQTKQWQRKDVLRSLKSFLLRMLRKEEKRIKKALRRVGVVWQSPSFQSAERPRLTLRYRLFSPYRRKRTERRPRGIRVWAGSRFRMQIRLKNRGKYTLYRVRAITQSKFASLNQKEFVFGKIRPGQTRRWTVKLDLPTWLRSQCQMVNVFIYSSIQSHRVRKQIFLKVIGRRLPRYRLSYALEELSGNGDGRIQPGERFAVRVTVANIGKGRSLHTVGLLEKMAGKALKIERSYAAFGRLRPAERKTRWFLIRIPKSVQTPHIPVHLHLFDKQLLTSMRYKIKLPVHLARPNSIHRFVQKAKWVRIKSKSTWVLSGAGTDSLRIGKVRRGARLQVLRRYRRFLKIKIPTRTWGGLSRTNKRQTLFGTGWIGQADTVVAAKGRTSGRALSLRWHAVTPRISVSIDRTPKILKRSRFVLRGIVVNNAKLLDFYIMHNGGKVYYRTASKRKKIRFRVPLRLKEGSNRIVLIARENSYLRAKRTLFLFYRRKASRSNKRLVKNRKQKRRPDKG